MGTSVFLSCENPIEQKESNSNHPDNASGISYFIDNKRVSEKYFFDLYNKDSLLYQTGYIDPRKAIINCGEEFRNGVMMFKKRM